MEIEITRTEFNEINAKYFDLLKPRVDDALKMAGLQAKDIDEILMIGGSTRIQKVKEIVREIFAPKQPDYTLNADTAVAEGAALIAHEIFFDKRDPVGDIVGKYFGIKAENEISVAIKHNQEMPCNIEKTFVNVRRTNEVQVEIYQGGKPYDEHKQKIKLGEPTKIGNITVSGLGNFGEKEGLIRVFFNIDKNGKLTVTAKNPAGQMAPAKFERNVI